MGVAARNGRGSKKRTDQLADRIRSRSRCLSPRPSCLRACHPFEAEARCRLVAIAAVLSSGAEGWRRLPDVVRQLLARAAEYDGDRTGSEPRLQTLDSESPQPGAASRPERPWESHYTTSQSVIRNADGSFRIWYASREQPPFVNNYFAINTATCRGPASDW